jgi:hypothetical protein
MKVRHQMHAAHEPYEYDWIKVCGSLLWLALFTFLPVCMWNELVMCLCA